MPCSLSLSLYLSLSCFLSSRWPIWQQITSDKCVQNTIPHREKTLQMGPFRTVICWGSFSVPKIGRIQPWKHCVFKGTTFEQSTEERKAKRTNSTNVTHVPFCVGKSFEISFIFLNISGILGWKFWVLNHSIWQNCQISCISPDFRAIWDAFSGTGNVTLCNQRVQR